MIELFLIFVKKNIAGKKDRNWTRHPFYGLTSLRGALHPM
jgi:hypothetical protein